MLENINRNNKKPDSIFEERFSTKMSIRKNKLTEELKLIKKTKIISESDFKVYFKLEELEISNELKGLNFTNSYIENLYKIYKDNSLLDMYEFFNQYLLRILNSHNKNDICYILSLLCIEFSKEDSIEILVRIFKSNSLLLNKLVFLFYTTDYLFDNNEELDTLKHMVENLLITLLHIFINIVFYSDHFGKEFIYTSLLDLKFLEKLDFYLKNNQDIHIDILENILFLIENMLLEKEVIIHHILLLREKNSYNLLQRVFDLFEVNCKTIGMIKHLIFIITALVNSLDYNVFLKDFIDNNYIDINYNKNTSICVENTTLNIKNRKFNCENQISEIDQFDSDNFNFKYIIKYTLKETKDLVHWLVCYFTSNLNMERSTLLNLKKHCIIGIMEITKRIDCNYLDFDDTYKMVIEKTEISEFEFRAPLYELIIKNGFFIAYFPFISSFSGNEYNLLCNKTLVLLQNLIMSINLTHYYKAIFTSDMNYFFYSILNMNNLQTKQHLLDTLNVILNLDSLYIEYCCEMGIIDLLIKASQEKSNTIRIKSLNEIRKLSEFKEISNFFYNSDVLNSLCHLLNNFVSSSEVESSELRIILEILIILINIYLDENRDIKKELLNIWTYLEKISIHDDFIGGGVHKRKSELEGIISFELNK